MASVKDLKAGADKAWANVQKQLAGMEPHLDRSDAPGEWTAREVLSHLAGPGGSMVDVVKMFSPRDYPTFEISPGETYLGPDRKTMTLAQLTDLLDRQRQDLFAHLESLPVGDLESRKLRIPLFKSFMGTDEIPLATFVGAMFDYHWNDHAGQLAKIRKAVGLPAAA